MTSKIGVKKIQYPNGTDIITLDSSGSLAIAGDLAVDTNTLKVDATNNKVGINTATPDDYYSDELVVTSADEGGMTFVTGTTHANYISFADGTSGNAAYRGFLKYDHNNDRMTFGTSGSSAIEVNSSGHLTVPSQLTCLLYKNGNQSVSQNTGFQVTGWAAVNDPASMYDNSNARITVPTAGQYIIGGHIQTNQVGGVHFSILKNGAAIGVDSYLNMGDALGSGYSICINCSANDYFTMGGYVTTAATNVQANRSKWWIQKVA